MKKQTKIVVLLLTLVMLLVGVAFAVSATDAEPASAETTHHNVTVSYTLPDATEATTVKIEYVPTGTTLLRALEEKSFYYIGTSDAATKTVLFVDRASHGIYNAEASVAANATVNADTAVDGNITVQLTNIVAVDLTDYPVYYDVSRTSGQEVEGVKFSTNPEKQTADGFKAAFQNDGRVIILTLTGDEDKIIEPSPATATAWHDSVRLSMM